MLKMAMKRKVEVVLLKFLVAQISVLSVLVFTIALVSYAIRNRKTSVEVVRDAVDVKTHNRVRSLYRNRLPLSGQVGTIGEERRQRNKPDKSNKHTTRRKKVKAERLASRSYSKAGSKYLLNATVVGTRRIEKARRKDESRHSQLGRVEHKRPDWLRSEQNVKKRSDKKWSGNRALNSARKENSKGGPRRADVTARRGTLRQNASVQKIAKKLVMT